MPVWLIYSRWASDLRLYPRPADNPCLKALPLEIGVNLEIRYASETDVKRERLLSVLDLNQAVDAVLQAVYEAAREQAHDPTDDQKRNRRVIFSGFDSTVSFSSWLQGAIRSFHCHSSVHMCNLSNPILPSFTALRATSLANPPIFWSKQGLQRKA